MSHKGFNLRSLYNSLEHFTTHTVSVTCSNYRLWLFHFCTKYCDSRVVLKFYKNGKCKEFLVRSTNKKG